MQFTCLKELPTFIVGGIWVFVFHFKSEVLQNTLPLR